MGGICVFTSIVPLPMVIKRTPSPLQGLILTERRGSTRLSGSKSQALGD